MWGSHILFNNSSNKHKFQYLKYLLEHFFRIGIVYFRCLRLLYTHGIPWPMTIHWRPLYTETSNKFSWKSHQVGEYYQANIPNDHILNHGISSWNIHEYPLLSELVSQISKCSCCKKPSMMILLMVQKSQTTTQNPWNPANNRIFIISTGFFAGFLVAINSTFQPNPSTHGWSCTPSPLEV